MSESMAKTGYMTFKEWEEFNSHFMISEAVFRVFTKDPEGHKMLLQSDVIDIQDGVKMFGDLYMRYLGICMDTCNRPALLIELITPWRH